MLVVGVNRELGSERFRELCVRLTLKEVILAEEMRVAALAANDSNQEWATYRLKGEKNRSKIGSVMTAKCRASVNSPFHAFKIFNYVPIITHKNPLSLKTGLVGRETYQQSYVPIDGLGTPT